MEQTFKSMSRVLKLGANTILKKRNVIEVPYIKKLSYKDTSSINTDKYFKKVASYLNTANESLRK